MHTRRKKKIISCCNQFIQVNWQWTWSLINSKTFIHMSEFSRKILGLLFAVPIYCTAYFTLVPLSISYCIKTKQILCCEQRFVQARIESVSNLEVENVIKKWIQMKYKNGPQPKKTIVARECRMKRRAKKRVGERVKGRGRANDEYNKKKIQQKKQFPITLCFRTLT